VISARAYGGVVIDDAGRILLREPRGHYDGYTWTFPKGRPEDGESAEAAAVREVWEETGVLGRVVAPIPGTFPGSTTTTIYYLMSVAEDRGLPPDNDETQSLAWATEDEARALIARTINEPGRKRDLAVLHAAYTVFRDEWRGQ
jgi:8-oxo-dGTP pyrophosphatase MutT (NUDIX family)